MDPEDVLQLDEAHGLKALPALPNHFQENAELLAALDKHFISFR
jgi:hypothetical protein